MANTNMVAEAPANNSMNTTTSASTTKPPAPVRRQSSKAVHYTAIIRLPFARGGFVDPPLVNWDAAKDKRLWKILSRNPRSSEIDWKNLAAEFDVSLAFILQQAAFLYERQLNQVRAQMRRVTKPGGPSSSLGIHEGQRSLSTQQSSRKGSADGGQRLISTLTGESRELHLSPVESSVPGTPKQKAPTISRTASNNTVAQVAPSPSRGAKSSLRTQQAPEPDAVAGEQRAVVRSPQASDDGPSSSSSSSDSEQDLSNVKRSQAFRRTPRFASGKNAIGKSPQVRAADKVEEDDDDEEDDAPVFLPLSKQSTETRQDLVATIRTTEKSQPAEDKSTRNTSQTQTYPTDSPTSSASSAAPVGFPRTGVAGTGQRPPGALSPRHRAELAGMSPRRQAAARDGSDGSPSMGSSFSELDDASVTQSALEEALLSNMQRGGGGTSRLSMMSQPWPQ